MFELNLQVFDTSDSLSLRDYATHLLLDLR